MPTRLPTRKSSISELGVERDLELERRKARDLMDAAREKDKEYQKLKTQYDNLKRKTILAPGTLATAAANEAAHQLNNRTSPIEPHQTQRIGNMADIAGGMDANRVQRTPLRQAQASNGFIQQPTRMGINIGMSNLQRRATTTAASRAFSIQQRPPASISGSEIEGEEDRFQHSAGQSMFQSVGGGIYGKGRNAPRVVAQPTQARTGGQGFRPAGVGFGAQ
ncbi:E3 ubiquitin-protein ligase CCNP1IP1 [Ceratobasidium sp. AG-Ba]|nr:E3 ubiquitin-protein ligase CCNP1IP1 [Ceratobasidium sp. AG-Ba]